MDTLKTNEWCGKFRMESMARDLPWKSSILLVSAMNAVGLALYKADDEDILFLNTDVCDPATFQDGIDRVRKCGPETFAIQQGSSTTTSVVVVKKNKDDPDPWEVKALVVSDAVSIPECLVTREKGKKGY